MTGPKAWYAEAETDRGCVLFALPTKSQRALWVKNGPGRRALTRAEVEGSYCKEGRELARKNLITWRDDP